MVIKLLIKLGVKKVMIAGADGYDEKNPYVYSDAITHFDFSNVAKARNESIKKELNIFKKSIDIEFLTPSVYNHPL